MLRKAADFSDFSTIDPSMSGALRIRGAPENPPSQNFPQKQNCSEELQTLVLKHDSVRQARNVGLFGALGKKFGWKNLWTLF
jgi:hypothetical protein